MNAANSRQFTGLAMATVATVALAAFAVGFLILPAAGPDATVWERICRAAGVVRPQPLARSQAAPSAYTSVVIPRSVLTKGTAEEAGRGATLSLRCTMCHGAQGMSGADAPNLAGQHADAIYKQLLDFQRGTRADVVMGAMAATLTEQDILDLSHYYARLPRYPTDTLENAPALIRVGDPMRNIAPCASCHGRVDGKVGAPALEGEPKAYLEKQLTAFRDGSRTNDANAAMRSETKLLTRPEIALLTEHYAASPL